MPFSSGNYTLPAGNPVVTGTVISSTVQNSTMSDIATALSTALLKDGSQTVTNNIPMAGFKFTGAGLGSARADSATIGNIQDGTGTYSATVGGTADAITLTPIAVITAYVAGQRFSFIAGSANTTAATVNVNAVGVKNITKFGTTPLVAGDIASGAVTVIEYDGTQFQLLGARVSSSGGALTVTARSTNTILAAGDLGAVFQFTSTFTQTITAAATLASGWYIDLQNVGTGVITLDANSSETFNTPGGARTTINIYPGEGFRLVCNGTGFDCIGRVQRVLAQTTLATASATVDMEQGFTDTEASSIDIEYIAASATSDMQGRLKKSGSYITGGSYGYGYTLVDGTAGAQNTGSATFFYVNGLSNGNTRYGNVHISRPTDAATQSIIVDSSEPKTGATTAFRQMGGLWESTASAMQGFRFYLAAGNIAGTFNTWINRG